MFSAAAQRLERAFDWPQGVLTDVAGLVILLHDVGKLSVSWQTWARQYQAEIEAPMAADFFAAHTDSDPFNAQHSAANKKLRGKRPTHAVESALAASPILSREIARRVRNRLEGEAIFKAAMTAICRHHGPFTAQPVAYTLEAQATDAVRETLPAGVKATLHVALPKPLNEQQMQDRFLIDVTRHHHVLPYLLFVRALRLADQQGTEEGSR